MELEEILKEKILYIQLYDGYSLIKHEELNKTCKMMDNLVCKIKELEFKLHNREITIEEQEEEIKALNRIINYGEEEEETPKEPIKEPEEWLPDFMVEEGKEKEYFAEAVRILKEALKDGKNINGTSIGQDN